MFKRRPLGGDQPQNPGTKVGDGIQRPQRDGFSQATGGGNPPSGNSTTPASPRPQRPAQQNQNRNRNRNNPNSKNQTANQNQPRQGQGQNPQRQGQNQNQNQPQGRGQPPGRGQNQRPPQQQNRQPQRRPPPPPPAYMQRDLLLVVNGPSAQIIDQVRIKFDPLAKKVPAHVMIIFPEPALLIKPEILKKISVGELPPVGQLVFSEIVVHDEMYLRLVPNEESREKLILWRAAFMQNLSSHTQEETYSPHMTLGYIPRSITPEEALLFAKGLISLPITVEFEKVLLEEFSENQISNAIDTISLTVSPGPTPESSEPSPA